MHWHLTLVMDVNHPQQRRPNWMQDESHLDKNCSERSWLWLKMWRLLMISTSDWREGKNSSHDCHLYLSSGYVTLEEKQIRWTNITITIIFIQVCFREAGVASGMLRIYFEQREALDAYLGLWARILKLTTFQSFTDTCGICWADICWLFRELRDFTAKELRPCMCCKFGPVHVSVGSDNIFLITNEMCEDVTARGECWRSAERFSFCWSHTSF